MMLGCLKDWIRKGTRERGKLSSPLPLISDVSEISNIECTSRIYPTCVWERVDRRAQRRRAGRGSDSLHTLIRKPLSRLAAFRLLGTLAHNRSRVYPTSALNSADLG